MLHVAMSKNLKNFCADFFVFRFCKIFQFRINMTLNMTINFADIAKEKINKLF